MRKWSERKGISQKAFALIMEVRPQTVQEWRKKGWLVMYLDGSINPEQSAKKLDRKRHPTKGGSQYRGEGPRVNFSDAFTPPKGPAQPKTLDLGADAPAETLNEARERKERWLAEKVETEVRKMKGELISLADAERAYSNSISNAKAALEAVAIRVSPQLVGLTSQVEIRSIIGKEMESALRGLSEIAPSV